MALHESFRPTRTFPAMFGKDEGTAREGGGSPHRRRHLASCDFGEGTRRSVSSELCGRCAL
jgi:hypothetical protein